MSAARKLIEQTKFDEIINQIYEGRSLNSILRDKHISKRTFFEHIAAVPLLENQYSRAMVARAELFVDEIVDIADKNTGKDESQGARNQIAARQWFASKMNPHKYGERLDLNVNQQVSIVEALNAAKSRIRDVLDISKTQPTESPKELSQSSTGYEPVETGSTAKNELDDLLS